MFYLVKTPEWVKKVFKNRIWDIPTTQKIIYLSFDDGPHPDQTVFVLDELKKYNAKATFFCIGKNVQAYPNVYQRIVDEGHAVGNHTFDHLKANKTQDKVYLQNVLQAKQYIDSKLFRPPYGRVSGFIVKQLRTPAYQLNTVMWTVLSGDFDVALTGEQCLQNVLLNTGPGSIVVFHDSEKASARMRFALPKLLEFFAGKGFEFKAIRLIEDKKNGPG